MLVYLNDRLVAEDEAVVSVLDHGLLYGDGVYETIRAYRGRPFMLGEHVGRLERSASLIGLALPLKPKEIEAAVGETVAANGFKEAYIRITVTRGPGPPGLDPALCTNPTFIVMVREFGGYPREYFEKGVPVIIPGTRRNLREALDPRIKSLNFLNNIMAKREALAAGAFEALMLNHRGQLTECTVSNVFFMRGDALCTPSAECGILDGITRGHIIGLAREAGLEVREGEFGRDDIYSASEAFLTNTTMEVMPVGSVDRVEFPVGSVAKKLKRAYEGLIEMNLG